jgi:hypothetical protein
MTDDLRERISHNIESAVVGGVSITEFVQECHHLWIENLQSGLESAQKDWEKIRLAMIR